MKKSIFVFLVAAMVIFSSIIWYFGSDASMKSTDLLHFGVIFLVVAFALFIGYKRWTSEKRGEPAEDELSKRVLQKTAAISYYISLYLWVFLLFIKDRISMDTEEIIGTGILGMALIFAVSWLIIHFKGLAND
jgi:peptidoglycan/LPS O-acetylase OafA/YrhL